MKILYLLIVSYTFASGVVMADEMSKADSLFNSKKHFSFAVQYKNNGELQLAYDQYIQSIALNDTVYQVIYSFADLLTQMNRTEEAHREYLHSLALNPEHKNSAIHLARFYYEAADYDSSLVMYERIYKLAPDNALLESIADLKVYLDMKAEALGDYGRLIGSGNTSYETLMKATDLAYALKELDSAQKYITMALRIKPGEKIALETAASISLALSDTENAGKFLRAALKNDTTDMALLLRLEALYRSMNNSADLIWALEHHTINTPQDLDVLGELSELLYNTGETDRSIEYIQKGLKLAPGNGRLRILMGEHYRSQGENKKALAEYEIALEDDKWQSSAQQLIWKINTPLSDEEKTEQDFFRRGKVE